MSNFCQRIEAIVKELGPDDLDFQIQAHVFARPDQDVYELRLYNLEGHYVSTMFDGIDRYDTLTVINKVVDLLKDIQWKLYEKKFTKDLEENLETAQKHDRIR